MIGMLSLAFLSYKGNLDYDVTLPLWIMGTIELFAEIAIIFTLIDKLV